MTLVILKTNLTEIAALPDKSDEEWLSAELNDFDDDRTDLDTSDDTVFENEAAEASHSPSDEISYENEINQDTDGSLEDYSCPHVKIVRREFLYDSSSIASGYFFIDRDDERRCGDISVSKQIQNGSSFVICRSGVSVEHACYEIYPHFNFTSFPDGNQFARMLTFFNKNLAEIRDLDEANCKIQSVIEDIYDSGLNTDTKRMLAGIISEGNSLNSSLLVIKAAQDDQPYANCPSNDEGSVSGIMGLRDLAGYFANKHFEFVVAEKESVAGEIRKLDLFVNEVQLTDSGNLHLLRSFFEMIAERFPEKGERTKLEPGSYYANLDCELSGEGSANMTETNYLKPVESSRKENSIRKSARSFYPNTFVSKVSESSLNLSTRQIEYENNGYCESHEVGHVIDSTIMPEDRRIELLMEERRRAGVLL